MIISTIVKLKALGLARKIVTGAFIGGAVVGATVVAGAVVAGSKAAGKGRRCGMHARHDAARAEG